MTKPHFILPPAVKHALAELTLPWEKNTLFLDSNCIETIQIDEKKISITLHVSDLDPILVEPFRAKVEGILQNCDGIEQARVFINTGNEKLKRLVFPPKQPQHTLGNHSPDLSPLRRPSNDKTVEIKKTLEHIGCCIAIASGKGGVGKSSTTVNLAVMLAHMGLTVGIMDADVYGPSIPRMLGLDGPVEVVHHKLSPMNAWGVSAMSVGMLVKDEQAMIWRGPMVVGAIKQLLADVSWGKLDLLLIDTPPGTGDVLLTLTQTIHLDGAIIISTPQDIALLAAKRGLSLFQKTAVPILGIIENMAYFVCPKCHEKTYIFGKGGAQKVAANLDLPFLGEIPLMPSIREGSDTGRPIDPQDHRNPITHAYREIANSLFPVIQRMDCRSKPID
ncbi:Iron-sulfur cluster carrier protein [Commensalibacter sp. Nvir]|uniref:Mrp/NBP35 family ATP-binding protein n=1 Tax=Commensalibacter sp. Nvir TaxID=3069817 RepID=UPI002D64E464|nr:Iron-sulfur cluster carrier protein [Commensalibacter sp. Nvir]